MQKVNYNKIPGIYVYHFITRIFHLTCVDIVDSEKVDVMDSAEPFKETLITIDPFSISGLFLNIIWLLNLVILTF